jgi:hypothetical protein
MYVVCIDKALITHKCHFGLKYLYVHTRAHVHLCVYTYVCPMTRVRSKEITKSQVFHVDIKKCTSLALAIFSHMNSKKFLEELIAYFPLL